MKLAFPAALVALLVVVGGAQAQRTPLVAPLPQGTDPAQVLQTARQVLVARGWKVTPDKDRPRSIFADRSNLGLRIYVADGVLYYFDRSELQRGAGQYYYRNGPALAALPQAELNALRADLTAALSGEPASVAGKPAAPPSQVLIAGVPADRDPARVMDAVRGALAARRWSVLPDEGGAVVAHIRSGDADSKLKIFLADGALRFIDQSTRREGAELAQVPDRWIGYLRADITQAIAALPVASAGAAAPTANAGSATERLRTLKSLLDGGMITQEEYDKKRAQILGDL